MHIWTKRVCYISAFIVFLTASMFFIFLALGYTYNFSKNRFEKTSVLYIKSYPRGADIFLNNKKYKKTTPTEITHLKPDLYNIKVEKDEYQGWEKQFLIKPEQTVFIEDISLFFNKSQSIVLENGEFQDLSLSPDQQKLLFYDKKSKRLNIFDLLEKRVITLEKNINEIQDNLWSSDSQKVLLKIDNKYFISYVYLNLPLFELSVYVKFQPDKFFWDKFDSDFIYLFDTSKRLYKFDLRKKRLERMPISNVLALKPEKDKIFYISDKNKEISLYLFDIHKSEETKILDLNNSSEYEFIFPYRDYFCLLDRKNHDLYLINPNSEKYLIKVFPNVKKIDWDLYNRILLFQSDFEIWFYDLITKEERLINRFSQNMSNSFWHKNNNHIFYILGDKVYISELDDRDRKNNFYLDNIYNSNFFLSNKKGNVLYHITPNGLVKSTIQ